MKKKLYEKPIIYRLNTGVPAKHGSVPDNAPITAIAGIPVEQLAKDFGSPLFVMSEKTIRQNYQDANRAFKTRYPKVQFAWSYKTNYLSAVCNVYHQEGSWAEVVSGFEYDKAIRNRVPGSKIIFNGPDKSREELEVAIANSSFIHIDHLDELNLIRECCDKLDRKAKVAVRINMETGVLPTWDRFGFNYENGQAWDAISKVLQNEKLDLVGLHCHIGTYLLSASAYSTAAAKMCELALRIKRKYKLSIQYLDMGGGFASRNVLKAPYGGTKAVPTFDQYADAICSAVLSSGFDENDLPLLVLETGRALVDDASWLVGTVVSNKRLSDGRRAVIVDFGVNILFTAFWYDHTISPARIFEPNSDEPAVVYGPLCMNIDVIRENVLLPPLNNGDRIVVHCTGAYNMTQWMQFITLRPAVVMIDSKEKAHLIRNRETGESIDKEELLPAHLKEFRF